MAELDQKMEIFKKNMKQRLIDMPTSFEDQSKLIKYLKVMIIIIAPSCFACLFINKHELIL